MLVVRERGGRLDGVDSDDRTAEALLVGPDLGGQIGQRRLVSKLASQLFARSFELTPLPAAPARSRVLAQSVDHCPSDATFGERLEFDAPRFIEPVSRVDEPDDPILDEVSDID
jgi:hypothetical protein